MMPVSKHGDPQLGVDIHLCVVPPSPSPVPLPTPHTSIVFDPFDYVPIIGATVSVCGMKRATAGTNGMAIHIPPGFPFAPKLPDKDDELFMGSSTVVADGDPFSFIALPVLSCQIAGMISPFRAKKKGGTKAMVLPTVFNLAIPTTVFVGGPPTISLIGLAVKGAFAALGKFAKSGLFKRIRQKLFKNLNPGVLKCVILRAEPVNILTGEVVVEQEDFTLPGRIPLQWVRSYTSGNSRAGACGYGWETPADIRLEVDPLDGSVSMRHPTAGPLIFAGLPIAPGAHEYELELMDGARLTDHGTEFRVRTKDDRVYHFPKALASTGPLGATEYQIQLITDLCGNWLEFERRGSSVIAINESAGRRIEIVTDGRIREIALVAPGTADRHVFVRYEYDSAGDLVAVIDALGNPYRFSYDEHHLVQHTDRRGLSFYYEYDAESPAGWRVVHSWGDGGLYDYAFANDDVLSERRITDSLGHVSLVKLDERGLPISEIDPLGGMTIFEYDESGRTVAVLDPAGGRTGFTYDERGNLLIVARPDGTTVEAEFDAENKPVVVRDATGAGWPQRWDARGLLIERVTPLGNASHYEYDDYGQLVTYTDPRGGRTVLTFDGIGNLVALDDAGGHRTRFSCDRLGNVLARLDALDRRTSYRYDASGRLTDVRLPSGAGIHCDYDGEGSPTRYVDENGHETHFSYVGLGEVKRRTQPDGHYVEYEYDTEERLIAVTNQSGELYRLDRDPCGRVVEETDYWGQTRRYAFGVSGHLQASTDPLGRTIRYRTDPLGRILARTSAEGVAETFAYDGNGNLIEAGGPHGKIKRSFDAEGRLVEEQQGTFTVTSAYDPNGNRVRRTSSAGNVVEYGFDVLDQATLVKVNDLAPVRVERDGIGRVVSEALGTGLIRRNRYHADGYLAEQAVSSAGAALFSVAFEYDPAGNLVRRQDSREGTDLYTYDPLGRITEHLDPRGVLARYSLQPTGGRLGTQVIERSRQRVVGDVDVDVDWFREGVYESTFYRFDRAGNLVDRHDAGWRVHFRWDSNQRLVESESSGTITRYGYDPLGRRLFKESGGRRVQFYWDGDCLIGESVVSTSGRSGHLGRSSRVVPLARPGPVGHPADDAREYVYVPGTFEPLCVLDGAAAAAVAYYCHNDANGAVTCVTDDVGTVVWRAVYSTSGEATLRREYLPIPLRLQGQYYDEETGLHFNRYRYYDPALGEFAGQDPLRLFAGDDLYGAGPNSLGWIDPLGLSCGRQGERIAKNYLESQGFRVIGSLQNRSGHGVDLIARDAKGALHFFEVKTTQGLRAPALSVAQAQGSGSFVVSRLQRAAAGQGAWGAVHDPHSAAKAQALLGEIAGNGGTVRGEVLEVTLGDGHITRRPW